MTDVIYDGDNMQVQGGKFAILPEWVLFHPDLSANAIRVYAALSRLSGCEEIRPSRSWIATKTGISTETVKRVLRELEDVEALLVTPRYDASGAQMSNLYRLMSDPPRVTSDPPPRVVHDPPPGSPVTHEVKKKKERTNPVPAAPVREMSYDFGVDPDAPPKHEVKNRAPSYVVVDHFLSEWHSALSDRPEYGMFQKVPNKAAAYTWLNTTFFKPRHGDPVSVETVIGLVDEFILRIRTDQITPSQGFTAWQCFVKNVGRLSLVGSVSCTGTDLPGTVVG